MRLIVVGDCVKLQHRTHIPSASDKNSSVDRKGIKRGACEEAGCSDCDTYFHDPQRGSQCQYCGCFPTKHRRIDGSSENDLEDSSALKDKPFLPQPPEIHIIDDGKGTMVYEVDDDGTITIPDDEDEPTSSEKQSGQQDNAPLSSLLSGKDIKRQLSANRNKENTPQKQISYNATFASLTSHLPREELYEFCVPNHIPVLPSVNGKGECVDSSNHFFILRWISWAMYNFKLATEKDYMEVAKLTMKRYPELIAVLPPDSKNVNGMVKAFKDLLHKQFFDRRGTNKKINSQSEPKAMSRPGLRTESIRISNNFSTMNIVSSIKPINSGKTAKSVYVVKPAAVPAPALPSTPTSAPTPTSSPAASAPAPAPVEHVVSKHFENGKAHIHKEMRKVSPSIPILQTFLSSIRKDRVVIAKQHQNYSTHILEFPCLEMQDLVVWEFIQQEQLQCGLDDLKKNWLDALPQMVEYFLCGSKDDYLSDSKTSDLVTMEILQTISTPAFFGLEQSVAKSEMRKSHVLEVFQDNILPLYIFPQKGDPPRLFSLGGADEVYVYLDGQAIFNGPILDALVFVTAVYHVFSLTPSQSALASFSFVFGILMKQKGIEMYKNHQFVYEALGTILKL